MTDAQVNENVDMTDAQGLDNVDMTDEPLVLVTELDWFNRGTLHF